MVDLKFRTAAKMVRLRAIGELILMRARHRAGYVGARMSPASRADAIGSISWRAANR